MPLSVCIILSHLAFGCVCRLGPLLCRCDAAGELVHASYFMHYVLSYYVATISACFCFTLTFYVLSFYF